MSDQAKKIDVKDLISRYSFEEHATLADKYFEMYDVDNAMLRKPFTSIPTAENILPKLWRVLESAKLFTGARICDFGAGTGWLASHLCLLGCEAVALDISQRALDLGRAHLERTAPQVLDQAKFLRYDGRQIPVEDGFFDRIIAFDSFHHVPNQAEVLAEMYRALNESGFAVFNEPGPRHSQTPESQMEMRNHQVIENDIIIEEVWSEAQRIGFERIELDMFPPQSLKLNLEEFNHFSSWESAEPLLRQHFAHYQNVWRNLRSFTLYKRADLRFDSRHRASLRGQISARFVEREGHLFLEAEVTNTGQALWRTGPGPGLVNLGIGAHFCDGRYERNHCRVRVADEPMRPGTTNTLINIRIPNLSNICEIELDLVSEHVAWFNELAPTLLLLPVPRP